MGEKRVKAVLFDLGETLINFGKINTAALFKDGARCSYEFLRQSGQNVCGFRRYYWRNIVAIRIMYAWSYIVGRDFDSLGLLRTIGIKRGYKLSEEQWQRFAWCWYEPLAKMAKAEPDIRQTLASLCDAGIKLGIVSNTFLTQSSLDRHLKEFGILEFFPLRMYSHEIPWRKPNVKIFTEAAHRLGIEPANIMFVGDRLDTDIRGAARAGMIPVLKAAYTNRDKRIPSTIRKISLLSELPSILF